MAMGTNCLFSITCHIQEQEVGAPAVKYVGEKSMLFAFIFTAFGRYSERRFFFLISLCN